MQVPNTETTELLTGEALETVRQYLYAGPDPVAVADPAEADGDPFTDDCGGDSNDLDEGDLADMRAANDPWSFAVEV